MTLLVPGSWASEQSPQPISPGPRWLLAWILCSSSKEPGARSQEPGDLRTLQTETDAQEAGQGWVTKKDIQGNQSYVAEHI